MQNKSVGLILIAVFSALWVGSACAMVKPEVCKSCHNGKHAVALESKSTAEIEEKLLAFKTGRLGGYVMPGKMKQYSRVEIKQLAKTLGKK